MFFLFSLFVAVFAVFITSFVNDDGSEGETVHALDNFRIIFSQDETKNGHLTKYFVENVIAFPDDLVIQFSFEGRLYETQFVKSDDELSRSAKEANVYTLGQPQHPGGDSSNNGGEHLVKHADQNSQVEAIDDFDYASFFLFFYLLK
jgi:hypothetical protein